MSLRSIWLLAALLAVSAVAQQWDDVMYSWAFNVTPTKLCAVEAPSRCVYIIRLNMTVDPNKTVVVATYPTGPLSDVFIDVVAEYSMLQLVTINTTVTSATIYVPRAGVLYASDQFTVGRVTSVSMRICNSYYYAVPVSAGYYTVRNVRPPLYLLVNNETCTSYKLIASLSTVPNITAPWVYLYVFEMPTARYRSGYVLNGTAHVYTIRLGRFFGKGFYLADTAAPLVVSQGDSNSYGPVHFSALNKSFGPMPPPGGIAYTIGWSPGDGIALFWIYQQFDRGKGEVLFLGDGFGGYFVQENAYRLPSVWRTFAIYAPRYSLIDITIYSGTHLWHTRTVACPRYRGDVASELSGVGFPYRVDQAAEVEICNNSTYTLYAGAHRIYITGTIAGFYMIDRLDPGACRRFRWDVTPDFVYFYNSTQDVCRDRPWFYFHGSGFTPGWRYYVTQDRRLVRSNTPIALDDEYAQMLYQMLHLMQQKYNEILDALLQWLQTGASQNFSSYVAAQPRFVGTIRLDSATSTWLRTALQELQKWQAVGAPGSFAPVSLPTVPAAIAPAAAAAVAVAWAASRRDDDVAAAAAVAGIALALFGILMTLIYGTSSLTLVALGVIVAAAAAAWRRIS